MNICGGGVCVCDGGSDVIGEDSRCADSRRSFSDIIGPPVERRYYFDSTVGVVISVEPHEMEPGTVYYFDPSLTRRAV